MSAFAAQAGLDTTRVDPVDHSIAQQAQRVVAAYALTQPDPQEWCADILNMLGIRARTPVSAAYLSSLATPNFGTNRATRTRPAKTPAAATGRRKPGPEPGPPPPCGTPRGYHYHWRIREPVDRACRDAYNTYQQTLRHAKGVKVRVMPDCGTVSGYDRHARRREKACRPCVDANTTAARTHRHPPQVDATGVRWRWVPAGYLPDGATPPVREVTP